MLTLQLVPSPNEGSGNAVDNSAADGEQSVIRLRLPPTFRAWPLGSSLSGFESWEKMRQWLDDLDTCRMTASLRASLPLVATHVLLFRLHGCQDSFDSNP